MRKALLLPFLVAANISVAGQLDNFTAVKSAVIAGKPIHIVTDFTQCVSSIKNAAQPTHMGVFTPNEMQVTDNGIATSLTHFTLNNPSYPNTPVYEFVRYTITSDDSVTLSYQDLDARNYSSLTNVVSLNCKMKAGVKIYI